jgi:hypothetical protein
VTRRTDRSDGSQVTRGFTRSSEKVQLTRHPS